MEKYKKDRVIKCQVTGIENYGIFVNIDSLYSGLIHISEITKGFVKDIKDYVNIGDVIYCKILEVDEDTLHMKLSIKDIDYKNTGKKKCIVESTSGFTPLEKKLPEWTEEKLLEMEQ